MGSLFENIENEYFVEDSKNHIAFVGCKKCGYSKYHIDPEEINTVEEFENVEFSKHHFTCICNLFKSTIICCTEGYKNMLFALPFIAVHAPLPKYTSKNIIYNGRHELAISISRDDYTKLNSEVLDIQFNIIKNFDCYLFEFKPIEVNFVEN